MTFTQTYLLTRKALVQDACLLVNSCQNSLQLVELRDRIRGQSLPLARLAQVWILPWIFKFRCGDLILFTSRKFLNLVSFMSFLLSMTYKRAFSSWTTAGTNLLLLLISKFGFPFIQKWNQRTTLLLCEVKGELWIFIWLQTLQRLPCHTWYLCFLRSNQMRLKFLS